MDDRRPRRIVPRDPFESGLDYVGKVGTGFSSPPASEILESLRATRPRGKRPLCRATDSGTDSTGAFCHPELVGEVQFAEWTSNGNLRHPSWRGLRTDKSPSEVIRES